MTALQRTAQTVALHRHFGLAKRRQRIPRQIYPKLIELEYAKAMVSLVRTEIRPAFAPLLAELPALLSQSIAETSRQDVGESSRARMLIEQAKLHMNNALHPARLEALATTFADRTQRHNKEQLGRQVKAALGIDVLTHDSKLAARVEHFVNENVALIKSIPADIATGVEKLVTRAFAAGTPHPELAKHIEERFDVGESRARLIARDQVGKLAGQINSDRQQALGITRFVWRAVMDERTRPEHEDLNDQEFDYDDPPDEGLPGEAVCCFPGDTFVSSETAIKKLYRRFYRGECAVITTHDGRALTATANHPILTTRGWIAAHQIQIGDDIVKAPDERFEVLVADDQHRVPMLEQVFSALAPLGRIKTSAGTAGWFHGDGTDEQVDVVDMDGLLSFELDPEIGKAFCQDILARANDLAFSSSPFDLLFDRVSSGGCFVSGGSKLLALLWSGSSHASEHCFGAIAWLDAVAQQLSANGRTRDAELFSKLLNAPPVAIEIRDFLTRVVMSITRRALDTSASLDSPSAEDLAQIIGMDADGSSGFGKGVGRHQFDRVVDNRRSHLEIHVYNLETRANWYAASGLIVHNCRCSAEPIFDDILDAIDGSSNNDDD